MIGRTISHYRVVSHLGAGGMGVVYRAEDDRLGRAVALKFLPEELANDHLAVERLRAEARAASALNHGNICAIYDIGEDQGRPYIVMELLKGQNLRDRLAGSPLKIHQIVDIGIQIADALDAAHGHNIIHRDIKPANIFLTDRQQVKLLDFGVAKLTTSYTGSKTTVNPDLTVEGQTIGTISYMSPEQATGETLDGRSDLFSLGVVLYECATGRQPFTGKTSAVILSAILNRAPVAPVALNPDLPSHLQDIINNCLEKDRELRYQSAADLRADLKRLRREIESGQSRAVDVATNPRPARATTSAGRQALLPGEEPTQPLTTTKARPTGNRPLIAALIVAVGLIAAGSYLLWQRRETPPPAAAPAPAAPAALTDADVRSRIDQAAAEIAARLAEQAKEKERAAPTAAPRTPSPEIVSRPSAVRKPSEAARSEQPPPAPEPPLRPASPRTATAAPAPDAVPAPATAAPPVQIPPRVEPPPASVAPPTPAPAPAAAPVATPPPAPAAQPGVRRDTAPAVDDDEAAIRRVVATYARAIESKDLALFRSVKPNLSREEQRRLEEGFRAVSKQSVNVTILSIDRKGQEASVVLRRRDTIQAGGRQQQAESQQTLTLSRSGTGWQITEIR